MALKPLTVKIGADTTALERGLNKAGRSIAGLAKAAGAAGVLVAGALAAMTTQGLAAVDAQTKLARSIDGSANSLRAVQIAAGYAGVSVGEANTAMQQLNRELERAKEEGSPAADALKKLRLQANDLAGLDVDDRMALLADRINALGLSSGQASDILRDLGIRSRNMALLLIQGGDAIRSAREEVTAFGLELTKTQTDSIESANDAVARMGLVFEGLRNRLAVEVAPMLQTVADRFNTLAQSDAVQTAIERLAGAFGDLSEIILSEDFIQTAIDGLTGLANIASGAAEGMVTIANNVEIVTIAFSGLAIILAGLSAPITAIGVAAAAATAGFIAWSNKLDENADKADKAQAALDRLGITAAEFENMTLDERMDAATQAIDSLGISAGEADGILSDLGLEAETFTEKLINFATRIETVTIAFSGLAIAVAALGGPLTVVGGALAVALAGIAMWRRKAEDAATGSDTMKEALEGADQAQRNLNAALDTFSTTGAPNAGDEAIRLAGDNLRLAESALTAAEAELAKKAALEETLQAQNDAIAAERRRLADVNANVGEGEFPTLGTANMLEAEAEETAIQLQDIVTRYSAAADAVEAARARLLSTQEIVAGTGLPSGGPSTLPTVRPPGRRPSGATRPVSREDARFDEYFGPADPEKPSAGLSTAEKLREQLEQRLEVLTQGLLTEREAVDMWYAEGMALLDEALKAEIIKQAEYNEQKERLEEEHQKRINAIKKAGAAADLATVAGAGAEILNAIGQNNKKALKLAKVFGAAEALISTYAGAANALKLPFPQNLAAAAAIIAKGIGFVNAIKSVNDNGFGGGGAGSTGAASSAASSAASAPPQPTQTVAINLQGDTFSRASVEGLLEQIQSQLDRGGRLVFQ
jgi:hypothetical protein